MTSGRYFDVVISTCLIEYYTSTTSAASVVLLQDFMFLQSFKENQVKNVLLLKLEHLSLNLINFSHVWSRDRSR